MTAALAAMLSGVAFFASAHMGTIWPLAWVAATPVLWLAFGGASVRDAGVWRTALMALIAYLIGRLNLLPVYYNVLPPLTLAAAILLPAIGFAVAVLAARFVHRRLDGLAAAFAFAGMWTAIEYAGAMGPDGATTSIAYGQVGAPWLVQTASLFGMWCITFLIGLVSSAAALALARRRLWPALFAAALFLGNAGYGLWHVRPHSGPQMRVALIDSDELDDAATAADHFAAMNAVALYAGQIDTLAERKPDLYVLPERLAVLGPQWRQQAERRLMQAAKSADATIVGGFALLEKNGSRNAALVFRAGAAQPQVQPQRPHLSWFDRRPQPKPLMTARRIAVALGHDMRFPRLIRADARAHPLLVAVPARDFGDDGYAEARIAIMRSIENGFALARTARDGVLSITDSYGREAGRRESADDTSVTLVKTVALGRGGGFTLYARIGDLFAWVAGALALVLLCWATFKDGRPKRERAA